MPRFSTATLPRLRVMRTYRATDHEYVTNIRLGPQNEKPPRSIRNIRVTRVDWIAEEG